MQTYTKWYEHGEPCESNNEMSDTDHTCGIDALVEDRMRGQYIDMAQDEAQHKFQEEEVRILTNCWMIPSVRFIQVAKIILY
jgi:hypothetical protein